MKTLTESIHDHTRRLRIVSESLNSRAISFREVGMETVATPIFGEAAAIERLADAIDQALFDDVTRQIRENDKAIADTFTAALKRS